MALRVKDITHTKAERVTWMTKTSDIVGSHMKTDLDSYLTLIRRKIQEKCFSTQDLIIQIRRNKIGDSGHVTPNEFRFTLIKFGIILAQPLVDRIFAVFDSDRSGTMDFDEFAMWIMNSEFRPTVKTRKEVIDTPEEILRKKFLRYLADNPNTFALMKHRVSYLEFVSEISSTTKASKLSDIDARAIFLVLDPYHTGSIDAANLKHWTETGVITKPGPVENLTTPRLSDSIYRVCGRNTKQMHHCFAHIPEGQGIKLSFEEFRRCLLNSGLGRNISDSKHLFLAIGGKGGMGDIDTLRHGMDPIVDDPKNPEAKAVAPAHVHTGRADRYLRTAVRRCFAEVKAELEAADKGNTGFVDSDVLYRVIASRCTPISQHDFRYVVQQLRTEDGGARVNWMQFLNVYNPRKAPHVLEANATLREDASSYSPVNNARSRVLAANFSSTATDMSNNNQRSFNPFADSASGPASSAVAAASAPRASTAITLGTIKASNFDPKGEMKRIWQNAVRECHRLDPDRSGLVSRVSFISALEKANLGKNMTAEAMNKLADSFTISQGLVDYQACFRNYVNDMMTTLPRSSSASALPNTLASGGATAAVSSLNLSPSKSRDIRPLHPWEFDYKRERHQAPYWSSAASLPRDILPDHMALPVTVVPNPSEKRAKDLNPAEKEALLSQYTPRVLNICGKCYDSFVPIWRDLRNELKKGQITSQRGSILTLNFLAILEHYGIKLSKNELDIICRSFRGLGMQDVVKYDEFLRVCLLVKSS